MAICELIDAVNLKHFGFSDEGLNEIAADCPTLNCSSNCLIPDMDGRGCLMSCHCRTSGLWGDIMMSGM